MKASLVKLTTRLLGKLKEVDFNFLLDAVVSWDDSGKPGLEKAAIVANIINPRLGSAVKWTVTGVVWLAYAYARLTGRITRP